MKRIFLLFVSVLCLNSLKSQQRFYSIKTYGLEVIPDYNSVNQLKLGYKPDSLLRARGIRKASVQSYTTRMGQPGKTLERDSQFFSFSEQGYLLEHHFLKQNRGGKWHEQYSHVYTRGTDGKPNSMLWQPGGKPWIKTNYYRNSRGSLDSTVTMREGKLLTWNKTVFRYNDSGKLLSRISYSKNREVMRWEQEFFPDGSLSVSKYFRKGKLQRVEYYTCNPRGEEIPKNTALVCRSKEVLPDGRRLEIWNSDDGKKPVKHIYCYDRENRILFIESWNNKARPYYSVSYTYQGDTIRERRINRGYMPKNNDSLETISVLLLPERRPIYTEMWQFHKGRATLLEINKAQFTDGLTHSEEEVYPKQKHIRRSAYRFY
jgi:hypothetical protein